jgi:hypothetical protein
VFSVESEIKSETIDLTEDEDDCQIVFDMTGGGRSAEEPIEVY